LSTNTGDSVRFLPSPTPHFLPQPNTVSVSRALPPNVSEPSLPEKLRRAAPSSEDAAVAGQQFASHAVEPHGRDAKTCSLFSMG
jgi:hypothetical protein